MQGEKVPFFKFMHYDPSNKDKELEIQVFETHRDKHGDYISYLAVDGKLYSFNLSDGNPRIYRPEHLGSLHYKIMCSNLEMIELKEKVGKAPSC